jgi:hypothetical protein
LHLYESAGFHNIRNSISYVKDVWSMLQFAIALAP